MWQPETDFATLVGKTITRIEGTRGDDRITIHTSDGYIYSMYHEQDCCESVYIEDIEGDYADLINLPLVLAEVSTNSDDAPESSYDESFTWTFYRLATEKGFVVIRWYGSSNGYYSESVSFYGKLDPAAAAWS